MTNIFICNFNFTLNVDADSKGAKNKLTGIIGGVPVPFPVAADCCANKNLDCPIKSGNPTPYNIAVYISPQYPKVILIKNQTHQSMYKQQSRNKIKTLNQLK